MAKGIREKIKLVSSAGTGHFYTTTKNKRTKPEKLELKKFDPVVRQHVLYKEAALSELEQIVTRLEGGDLPLEEALNEFERGVQLARQGQVKLQQAEQRVQILLSDTEDAALTPFTPDNE